MAGASYFVFCVCLRLVSAGGSDLQAQGSWQPTAGWLNKNEGRDSVTVFEPGGNRTCPYCGADLDPAEVCDCLDTGQDIDALWEDIFGEAEEESADVR